MVAKIRRGGQEFEVADGQYGGGDSMESFDQLKNVLGGHPNGISKFSVGKNGLKFEVKTHGGAEDPINVKQTSGKVGDLVQEVNIGHYESTVNVSLFDGSGIELISQGDKMQIIHIKS